MKWSIIKNDLVRNKVINLALLLFMMFSACLAVLSSLMAVQTFRSISELYEKAQPPHFLQMHKGDMNPAKMEEFMASYQGLTYGQIQTMIDIYGENLTIVHSQGEYDLSDLNLDIGLVKQNESMDLLLNSEHEKVHISKGEIGMPVLLREMYDMKIGDKVLLNSKGISKEFLISEFILDSQMNSPMTSSTRILLSDEDFNNLENKIGEKEYLIEAYFTDRDQASSFQTAYENANLPQNGPAITYTMIFLLSALTDITTVFVLLLVSFLLIVISFICIKFTIMAALEEEISQIGILKAIGLPFKDIRDIYLSKYKILAVLGVITGFIFAVFISDIFTQHISTTFGKVDLTLNALFISLLAGFMVYLLILYYCKKVLKKVKKLTVVDALVTGNGFEKSKAKIKDRLHQSKKLSANYLLAVEDLSYQIKNWFIIFAVVLITTMMILIPVNLLNTLESPKFITYMGSSLEDILIEVENGENLEKGYEKAKQALIRDTAVQNYYEYRRVNVKTLDTEGGVTNLHIDSGTYAGRGLQYIEGRFSKEKNEIAISYLNAEKVGKATGDKIVLVLGGEKKEFYVSGVYQDVTSGGYTAKAIYDFPKLQPEKYTFAVNLSDNANIEKKAKEWSKAIGTGVSVDPMEKFINQTLGGVANQLKTIVFTIVLIGASMVMLITVLFLKLRLAKDLASIATLRAIGFSKKDIKQQYMIKTGVVSLMGIISGVLLTTLLGEKCVNAALAITGLGIKKVELMVNPLTQYILCPLLLMALILLVTQILLRTINKHNILDVINE